MHSTIYADYTSTGQTRCSLVDEALKACIAAKKKVLESNRSDSHLFNPLRCMGICETAHSQIVGDLLNLKGSHGQGDIFLTAFLTHLGIKEPTKGQWVVTVEKGRIDILLTRHDPRSVVIIENKSNGAADGQSQLYRYWYEHIHQKEPRLDYSTDEIRSRYKVVYLPPGSSKRPSESSLARPKNLSFVTEYKRVPESLLNSVSFPELMQLWLKLCTAPMGQPSVTNVRLTTFLKLYSELWNPMTDTELIQASDSIFDTAEKWNAILDFTARTKMIVDRWRLIAFNKIEEHFKANPSLMEGWNCVVELGLLTWYLQSFGDKSLKIGFDWNFRFVLLLDGGSIENRTLDADIVKDQIKVEGGEFDELFAEFGEARTVGAEFYQMLIESVDFGFDCRVDGTVDPIKLAWYAGHETAEFVKQVAIKISRITGKPKLTNHMKRLNEMSKQEAAKRRVERGLERGQSNHVAKLQ